MKSFRSYRWYPVQPENEGTRVDWEQDFEDEAVADSIAHVVRPSNEQLLDKLGEVLG